MAGVAVAPSPAPTAGFQHCEQRFSTPVPFVSQIPISDRLNIGHHHSEDGTKHTPQDVRDNSPLRIESDRDVAQTSCLPAHGFPSDTIDGVARPGSGRQTPEIDEAIMDSILDLPVLNLSWAKHYGASIVNRCNLLSRSKEHTSRPRRQLYRSVMPK